MTLKQKVRKYNKEFEGEIQSFRENPVQSEDEKAKSGKWRVYMYMTVIIASLSINALCTMVV